MTDGTHWNNLSDHDLVRLHREHPDGPERQRAACALLSRYRDKVYAWCYRRLGDPERARDLAQEVLLNAYQHLATFELRADFGCWLYVIARNRCFSELRRPQLLYADETEVDGLSSSEKDPGQQYMEKLSEEAILDLIRSHLEPLEQTVLWLRCFERMPVDRITQLLEIGQASGARGVLQRARRKLRAVLKDHPTQATEASL